MKGQSSAQVQLLKLIPLRETEDFDFHNPELAEALFNEACEAGYVERLAAETPIAAGRQHRYSGIVLKNEGFLQTALQHYRHSMDIAEEEWGRLQDNTDIQKYQNESGVLLEDILGPRQTKVGNLLIEQIESNGGIVTRYAGSPTFAAQKHALNAHILANEGHFQSSLKHYRHALLIIEEEWKDKGKDLDVFANPYLGRYYEIMNNAAIEAAFDLLSTVYPEEDVREALANLAANAMRKTNERASGLPRTAATAKEEPNQRLEWAKHRDLDEDPVHFARRAYAAEFSQGMFDKSLVRREDKTLYQRLYRDKAWGRLAELAATEVLTKSQRTTKRLTELAQRGEEPSRSGNIGLYEAKRYRGGHER